MTELRNVNDAPQAGAKVGFGILAFVVGLLVLLWIIKIVFGF
jgi:hypothetical protein